MMDASLCTVVILHQSNNQPYHIIDQEQQDDYQQLIKLNFGQVYIHQDPLEAIEKVKQCQNVQSTLLLVDLDAIQYNDSINRETYIVQFLQNITRDLNTLLPNYIPLVVCSKNDSTNLMLDCIHAGATDYLLKPLYLNVIKTLFLKLHRCQPDSNMHENVNASNTPPLLLPQQQSLPSPTAYQPLCDRINEMNSKDTHLSKILMDVFVPKTTKATTARDAYPNISKKRSAELKSRIASWDFSPFGLNQQELIHCVYLIFEQVLTLPELKHLDIKTAQLYDFIIDLASVYHDENPYHNFAHAVDVLQCLFFMLCELSVLPFTKKHKSNSSSSKLNRKPQDLLRPKDVFALLIAAIGHDAAHPGVNNMFLINSSNPLATLYNDRSVLESLHSMTLFQLLNKHGIIQLVGDTKSAEYREFRKTVVSSILATDMSLHLEYVTKIKEQATRVNSMDTMSEQQQESERNLICSALIKCADISNVARPFRWGAKWAELLVEEFVCQGDLEKELGMPVLPMNDRDQVILEDSQIGFIRFVALDLFQNVREILCDISFAVDQMQANLKQWETRKNTLTVHDSGVANLIEHEADEDFDVVSNTSTTQMMMVETVGSKRSSSSLDFSSHSPNDVKRLSIEKKTIYHHGHHHIMSTTTTTTTTSSSLHYDQVQLDDDHHDEHDSMTSTVPRYNGSSSNHHHPHQHQRRDAANPVYCQCSIQ
ncbi:high affinity camp protein [Mucor lusitanicus]